MLLPISYGDFGVGPRQMRAMRKVNFLPVMLLPDQLRECSINVAFFKWPVVYLLHENEPLCLFPPVGIILLNFKRHQVISATLDYLPL